MVYRKSKQQSFHNILRSVNLETKKTQKSKSIASNPQVLRKNREFKTNTPRFSGKTLGLATLALFDISTDWRVKAIKVDSRECDSIIFLSLLSIWMFMTVEFAQNSQFYLLTKPWGVDCGWNAIDSTINTSEWHYFIYYSWLGSEKCFCIGANKIFKGIGLRVIKSFVIKHENPPSTFIYCPNRLMQRSATFFLRIQLWKTLVVAWFNSA